MDENVMDSSGSDSSILNNHRIFDVVESRSEQEMGSTDARTFAIDRGFMRTYTFVALIILIGAVARGDDLPLKAARTFSLTTDEGTWMSLDVSPDGKTVVFDLLGHLYTMPVEGGQAKALTSGFSLDSQPRYSHDGKRIVFVSDRSGDDNLWVIN